MRCDSTTGRDDRGRRHGAGTLCCGWVAPIAASLRTVARQFPSTCRRARCVCCDIAIRAKPVSSHSIRHSRRPRSWSRFRSRDRRVRCSCSSQREVHSHRGHPRVVGIDHERHQRSGRASQNLAESVFPLSAVVSRPPRHGAHRAAELSRPRGSHRPPCRLKASSEIPEWTTPQPGMMS